MLIPLPLGHTTGPVVPQGGLVFLGVLDGTLLICLHFVARYGARGFARPMLSVSAYSIENVTAAFWRTDCSHRQ